MNNQFELFPETNIFDYYIDQSRHSSSIGDRVITASFTPWGIKEIDLQYSTLIQHMYLPIKGVYGIYRKIVNVTKYEETYESLELDSEVSGPHGVRVEWINGKVHNFFYQDRPIFDKISRTINVEWLIKNITKNPHLHVMIKENLLGNIDRLIDNDKI